MMKSYHSSLYTVKTLFRVESGDYLRGGLFRFELPCSSEKERVKDGDCGRRGHFLSALPISPISSLLTLNSSLYLRSSLFSESLYNLDQLFQKALLAEGVELEEHGLTAARSDGGKKQIGALGSMPKTTQMSLF